ncbi:MAG TPA: hypothetical protein VKQ70_02715, partial [Caulobacteraceae bacterium]|nr:hypothetical protein [Caulobacteraceae bacterium]
QGLAPAQALAMPRDAFGLPICSAQEIVGAHHRDPAHDRSHDCCAAACALAGLTGGAPPLPRLAPAAFGARVALAGPRRLDAPAAVANHRPNARGPPASSSTI